VFSSAKKVEKSKQMIDEFSRTQIFVHNQENALNEENMAITQLNKVVDFQKLGK